ncbi:MAG TPA: ABC transporter ATP-binding protein [Polyangia bacterium]|nr:ABC transporter ATP-binding protein [Polyangia bacterium]
MPPPHPISPPPPPSVGVVARLRASFSQSRQTLALVWRSSPGGTAALGVLTVLAAALPPAVVYVGKLIIDAVVAAHAAAPGVARDAAVARTVRLVLLELLAVGGSALLERALGLVRQLVGSRLGIDVNVAILEKALQLDLRHFEDPEFYDKLTRARREASSRPLSLIQGNFQLLRNALTLAGYVALLVRFSGWMVVALLAATVPAFIAEARFSGAAFRLRNWRSPDARRLNYLEYVMANDEHAKEVKLFGLGPLLLARYRDLAERFYDEDKSLAMRRAVWAYLLSLVSTLVFYGCYALIVVAAARGALSLGDMTLYLAAFRQGQQAFQSILTAVGGMYEDTLYMSNLFEFLAIPTPRAAPSDRVSAPATAVLGEEGIRFEGVGFRYPEADGWALRGIDLFLPKGQSLALVGENGAGKTTFIKLLAGLYRPTEGRVWLDGRDLRDWNEEDLRRRIGVIFQDFNQYQLLARENVAFGSVDHLGDDLRVQRAVEQGGARELVSGLTQGLDTQLGRWFKGGAELSGGQWQKVALARAFMREEADILILDEPTAALDAEAEHAVFERFRQLTKGRTAILISHRFPTVRMADRILVLEHGRVIEDGSHADLLAAGARYAQLFKLQAAGYR